MKQTKSSEAGTSNSYRLHALLAYAEAIRNAAIVERMKEACKFKRLRYHRECRCDLYNESVEVTTKSTRKCDSFYWDLLSQTLTITFHLL